MKPEAEKPARPAVKPAAANTTNDEKTSRPRSNRPAADKRPSKPKRQDSSNRNSNDRSKAPRAEKAEAPSKMGTFGALLQEAGVTKAKK